MVSAGSCYSRMAMAFGGDGARARASTREMTHIIAHCFHSRQFEAHVARMSDWLISFMACHGISRTAAADMTSCPAPLKKQSARETGRSARPYATSGEADTKKDEPKKNN